MLIIIKARSSHSRLCSYSQNLAHRTHHHAHTDKTTLIHIITTLTIPHPPAPHPSTCSYSYMLDHPTHAYAHNHKTSLIALIPMLIITKPPSSHTSLCS